MKQSQAINNTAAFFPNYFRKIGTALVIVPLVISICVKYLALEISATQKDVLEIISFDFLLLGLFFVAWAKDKFEDEMTMQNRMKALGFTFVTSIFYLVLRPFLDLILQDPVTKMSAQELMLFLLFMYIIFYRLQKRRA